MKSIHLNPLIALVIMLPLFFIYLTIFIPVAIVLLGIIIISIIAILEDDRLVIDNDECIRVNKWIVKNWEYPCFEYYLWYDKNYQKELK